MIFTMEETSQLTEYSMGYLRLITYVLENCIDCIESNSKRVTLYRKKKKTRETKIRWIDRTSLNITRSNNENNERIKLPVNKKKREISALSV